MRNSTLPENPTSLIPFFGTGIDVKHLELFAGMPDGEIDWMLAMGEAVSLETGDVFQRQGEPPVAFYITLAGEMQVCRVINGVSHVMGTNPPGVIGNEIALLRKEESLVIVMALMPTRLLVFDEPDFRAVFANCPEIGARILQIATTRMGNITRIVGQREKNAALGRLSAGLAHELNNPAAAARSSAKALRDLLPTVQHYTLSLNLHQLNAEQIAQLFALQEKLVETEPAALTAMERSDREEQVASWLEQIGIEAAYEIAGNFVTHGMLEADLHSLSNVFHGPALVAVVRWLDTSLATSNLMQTIDGSTQRISALVDAVKGYTYMDQGEVQVVDIHDGLENVLILLRARLGNRKVVRQFGEAMPRIDARGSEINEMWTQLIDNAIDATSETGTITLVTRRENAHVMVEVADDGHGIPDDVMPHVMEPFFTTKPIGAGLGLGLEIVNRILTGHSGTIDVQSRPGQTRVIVRLPIRGLNQ